MRKLVIGLLYAALSIGHSFAQGVAPPLFTGGTFTGAINFTGSGISTGLPTNGVYLNSANQCLSALPVIGLSGKDGSPLLQFMSSAELSQPPTDTIGLGYGALAAWTCAGANGPNLAFGPRAMKALTTGDHNIAFGNQAMQVATTASHNTAIGIDTLGNAVVPANMVTLGEHTLTNATAPTNGVFAGVSAGFYLGTTNFDTAIGFQAMQGLLANIGTGNVGSNTAVGTNALENIGLTASNNTAVGAGSLSSATYNASLNTAVGNNAGQSVTSGGGSIFIGNGAGTNYTTGAQGIFIGGNTALAAASGANGVICIGQGAVCGTSDTIVGYFAAAATNAINSQNTAVGNFVMFTTTGNHNTAMGFTAGQDITAGSNNLVLGYAVESNVSLTGNNNVFIGTSISCVGSGAAAANEIDICAGSTNVVRVTGAGTPSTAVTTLAGNLVMANIPSSAGSGGLFVCSDNTGKFYEKATCP